MNQVVIRYTSGCAQNNPMTCTILNDTVLNDTIDTHQTNTSIMKVGVSYCVR